ncbi:MAG: hypothetical protein KDD42_05625 [Bdellovibrionales bacterium]|nr:hypothetical protein [Bdellovibrionales bacterium]
MSEHSTNHILMVEPASFTANPETMGDNAFQHHVEGQKDSRPQAMALKEFRGLQQALEDWGVVVEKYKAYASDNTPDSIFPNNWFSTHENGRCVLYPMKCPSRRRERRSDMINDLRHQYDRVIDLTYYEERSLFLESTGSLVLDRLNKVAYGCVSERTSQVVAEEWAQQMGYSLYLFHACGVSGKPVYHTNVMLSLGDHFAVVCLDAVDADEREKLRGALSDARTEVVELSQMQMDCYCANLLELKGEVDPVIAMSKNAYHNFRRDQIKVLEKYGQLLVADVSVIEWFGGGSVRCMIAELF